MLIDRLAMAVHAADGLEALTDWEMIPDKQREGYVFVARAVLAQLEAEGLKVVPAEETMEMLTAAISAEDHGGDGDTWAAKLNSAPKLETLP